jgi:hypothetical protein
MKTAAGQDRRLTVIATALGLLGMTGAQAEAEPAEFHGIAVLCEVDDSGVIREEKDRNVVVSTGLLMRFRIETDHELINGWETLISNSRLDRDGVGYYWGYGKIVPDIAARSALEGEFRFASEDVSHVRGSYLGTGDLEGVVMNYELTPAEPATGDAICGGTPSLGGYTMSGTVEDDADEGTGVRTGAG